MRTQVPLRVILKTHLRNSRRWTPKSELESLAKSKGFLAYTAGRRLQEMTATSGNKKLVDVSIDKKEVKGQVHYRFV